MRDGTGRQQEVDRTWQEKPRQAPELYIELADAEWPLTYVDHDREIVRAIVLDEEGYFYFTRVDRDDEIERAAYIETSGGGIEKGEDERTALMRELQEELGATVEVLGKIGVVSDYYHVVHRHNINHYYLCRAISFGEKHLTQEEIECTHIKTLRLSYEEAVRAYEEGRGSKLGRLVANRELPVLRRVKELLG